jgi:colicin import membrane protein
MIFGVRHLLAALVLHALLFAMLAGGVQCSRKVQGPVVIQARLVTSADRKQPVRKPEEPKVEKPVEKPKEPPKPPPPDTKKEDERKRSELVQKKKEEDKKKAAEDARRKELEEQKRAEERKRQEQQRQEMVRQAMQEEAMHREIDQEQQARVQSETQTKRDEWGDALSRHVAQHWSRPSAQAGAFQCAVRVQLLPDGTVTSAKITKSCGNPVLDKSVEDAVFRSSPLPRPADPSIFERDLIINFVPEG